jgi:photosystem II stability/assembly factor-like uncharacterized protein
METLFIGYDNGLVRALVNGQVDAAWALAGDAPVAQIAVDPLAHDRMYAATLGAGLWRSDDAGRTFARLSESPNDLVWSVAVSASDRNDGYGTVYAGTQLSALFRSTDGGATFEELTSVQEIPSLPEWSFPPAPDTHHVHQITLSIDDPDVVVFGVELGGVYHSADRGVTWTRTTADPDPHTLRTHPNVPGRLYEGGGASYHESRDGGRSWTRGSFDGIPDDVRYFYSLAADAGDAATVLISGARDPFSGHGNITGVPVWSSVYRSSGNGWTVVADGLPAPDGTAMGALAAGSPGVFYYVTDPGEVYRSADGGRTFAQLEYSNDVRGGIARTVLAVPE